MVENQASQRYIRFYEIKLTPSNLRLGHTCTLRDNSTSLDKISNKYHITSIALKSSDLFDIYTLVA